MTVTLPWPPSVNGYWRAVRGRQITCKAGREYRKDVGRILARPDRMFSTERLEVKIILHEPDKRRRDLDNWLKAPLDAITHAGVWGDDSQIDRLVIERGERVKGGALVLQIGVI